MTTSTPTDAPPTGGRRRTRGGHFASSELRDAEAMRLHEDEGLTLDVIAERLGWETKGAVSRAIARAYARGPGAKVEEIRTRLTATLTVQLEHLMAEFVTASAAGEREDMTKLAHAIVRTTDAISRRNGTDAPQRIEFEGVPDEVSRSIRELTAEINRKAAGEPVPVE